ncbi:MAG: adenylate/guanylate cyclase domain-containing protein [Acidimicrobiia bacterium]
MTIDSSLPTGTVTFLFSDVEGSTGLLQRLTEGYKEVIERHAGIIRSCLTAHEGREVSTEGDSFFAVFTSAAQAVAAASDIQRTLADAPWPPGGTVAVRIGLHTGVAELGHDNYVGIDVNRAARISSAGHGGQVVVSAAVKALVASADYSDLGEHSLKGLEATEHLYQLDVAGLPQAFPPLRTESARPNNLPALASRLLGRDSELERLQALISQNRMVTITGPGGVGKTRLALEVANDVLTQFEQGAFLVDLAPIDDAQLVLPEIAATLGVEATAGDLAAALQDGARLLLLDNFEQVIGAASDLAEVMAGAAPIKVLATSQLPLRVGGEHVFRLEPLAATGAEGPAVELFIARAEQADPSFDAGAHRQDIARLVDALDGIPLAIELAAARVNVLTPEQVLERLTAGHGVLQARRADAPDRHRSISAAVAWSYELLTATQQEVLQGLSAFRGGATMETLEYVAERDPLDDLGELVDRSLVVAEPGTSGKRFHLLAPIQRYVEEQVADPELLANRHADFFEQLGRQAHEPLEGDVRARWLAILGDEQDNLRSTLDHLLAGGEIDRGYGLLGNIWRFFHSTGQLAELELWLQRFFNADEDDSPTMARAGALLARAAYFYWRAEWANAVADYEDALVIAEANDDRALIGEILVGLFVTLGNARSTGEDLGDPTIPAARAYEIFTDLGDKGQIATIEFGMALADSVMSENPVPPDREVLERIIGLYQESAQLMNVAHTQLMLAQVDIMEGDFAAGQRNGLKSLETAERAGDTFTIGWALRWVAVTVVELGNPELGARLAGAAEAARIRLGGEWPPNSLYDRQAEDLARAQIGTAADEAFEAGKQMGLVEAVRLARQGSGPSGDAT